LARSSCSAFADGRGDNANFANPHSICFDKNNYTLLVCDFDNNAIHRVTLGGMF
jgi:hypothetical protein